MKRIPAIIPFLVFVSAVFIGILIYVYVECKKANPQMIPVEQAFSLPCRLSSRHV
jgi:hypothetical protein